jgi:hypothetical protein
MTQSPRRQAHTSTPIARLLSTTEGRQRFPDLLQTCFGDKAVIGFDRYGRALGAVVPMEAVRLLAGYDEAVDPRVRETIALTAQALLRKVPAEARMCGINDLDLEEGSVDPSQPK